MLSWPINTFDAVVYFFLFVAVVMGFMTGMLRSLATIFGYLAAMGMVVAFAPRLAPVLNAQFKLAPSQIWIALGACFIVGGMVLGALFRMFINEMVGPKVSIPDRAAGALLGAVRVLLVTLVVVLAFDRIIPPGREPAFLQGSQWRPVLSEAGRQGLNALPPEVEEYIDRLKRQRGL
jgi:membrane protein required for colicin V production